MKIGTRILLPVIIVTIIFSAVLYFAGNSVINRLILRSLGSMVQAKVSDIATSEDRIATEMLTQAALFSCARPVKEAGKTGYLPAVSDQRCKVLDRDLVSEPPLGLGREVGRKMNSLERFSKKRSD